MKQDMNKKLFLLLTFSMLVGNIFSQGNLPPGGSEYSLLRKKSDGRNVKWDTTIVNSPLTYTLSTNTFGIDTTVIVTQYNLDTTASGIESRLTNTITPGDGIGVVQSGQSFTISTTLDTAITQLAGDSTTKIANTSFVDRAIDSLGTSINKKAAVAFNIFEGGGVIATGSKNYIINVPYSGTITGFYLYSTDGGVALNSNTVMDVWKDSEGNIPTVANTIFSGDEPTLSASSYDSDNTLSVSVSAGDVIIIAVTSNSAAVNLNLVLTLTKD